MPNMSLQKHPMPEQQPDIRATNFKEVALGYTREIAMEEADRCLHCKNAPCVKGCPVNVPIPDFIAHIKKGEFQEAYETIRLQNGLPAICGRVCPQETQCESKCVRGIKGEPVGIGRLERFAADYAMTEGTVSAETAAPTGKKAAVVGSGPAGLTCAADLARAGWDVTVYEALHTPGGVLMYGIPEFRLPKALVQKEIDNIRKLGVKIVTNAVVGRAMTVEELLEEGNDAVFVGSGAGLPNFQKIPGESLCGVYSANEFLTRINLMRAYTFPEHDTPVKVGQRVAICGGGPIGLLVLQLVKRFGATELTMIEPIAERRELAKRFGAKHTIDPAKQNVVEEGNKITNGYGFDVVLDASGFPGALEALLDIAAKGGTVIYGAMYPTQYALPLNLNDYLYNKELTLTGSYISPYAFPRALQLLEELDLEPFTEAVFPIDRGAEAFAAQAKGLYPKILIECNPGMKLE